MFCFNWISWISFIIFSASWEFLYETCQGPWKLVCQQTNQRSTQKVFVSWPSSKPLLSDYWAWTFKSLASSHGCHAPKAYFSVPWFHQAEGCLWGTHACDQVCSWLPPCSLTCSLHFSTYPLQDFFFLDNFSHYHFHLSSCLRGARPYTLTSRAVTTHVFFFVTLLLLKYITQENKNWSAYKSQYTWIFKIMHEFYYLVQQVMEFDFDFVKSNAKCS